MMSGDGGGESECFVAKMVRALLPLLPLFEAELCVYAFSQQRGVEELRRMSFLRHFSFALPYVICFCVLLLLLIALPLINYLAWIDRMCIYC